MGSLLKNVGEKSGLMPGHRWHNTTIPGVKVLVDSDGLIVRAYASEGDVWETDPPVYTNAAQGKRGA